jgi:NAD(P)-dependent dehydrogenase (short-subunit alcohol dehydrogenase family)
VRAAYGSSKAAIVSLTRYVATMYGADGIRCNAVAPALVMTDIAFEQLSPRLLKQKAAERVLPEATTPEDIAAVVAFLASSDAACVTGQLVVADGGTQAHRPDHAMRAWEAVLQGEPS